MKQIYLLVMIWCIIPSFACQGPKEETGVCKVDKGLGAGWECTSLDEDDCALLNQTGGPLGFWHSMWDEDGCN